MVFLRSFVLRFDTKTPLNFDLTCLISLKITTGLNRDRLSNITFGAFLGTIFVDLGWILDEF